MNPSGELDGPAGCGEALATQARRGRHAPPSGSL